MKFGMLRDCAPRCPVVCEMRAACIAGVYGYVHVYVHVYLCGCVDGAREGAYVIGISIHVHRYTCTYTIWMRGWIRAYARASRVMVFFVYGCEDGQRPCIVCARMVFARVPDHIARICGPVCVRRVYGPKPLQTERPSGERACTHYEAAKPRLAPLTPKTYPCKSQARSGTDHADRQTDRQTHARTHTHTSPIHVTFQSTNVLGEEDTSIVHHITHTHTHTQSRVPHAGT